MKVLKELANYWRTEAKSPTLAAHPKVKATYEACAMQLENAISARLFPPELRPFVKGNGVGLPHGTVAWVVADGRRYIREWHPMQPDKDGTQIGNWWDLEKGGMDKRFSEHEVSHYCVLYVPDLPDDVALSPVPNHKSKQPYGGPVEITAIVGKSMQTGNFVAFTILADLREGMPKLVEVAADSEEEALRLLQQRADDVLRTFLHGYRMVRL